MKQVIYEILKLLSKKIILLILSVLFLLNIVLFINNQFKTNDFKISNKDEIKKQEQIYANMTNDQALEKLSALSLRLKDFNRLQNAIQFNIQRELDYFKDNPDIVAEFNNYYKDHSDELLRDGFITEKLKAQTEHIAGYDKYIDSMQRKSDTMTSVSIFAKPNSFAYRNIIKTPSDFSHLKGTPLKLGFSDGLLNFINFKTTDIFLVLTIIILCIYMFWNEKESKLFTLIKSCSKGRSHVILSKITTITLLSLILVCLFYGSIMVSSGLIYGFEDGIKYIQSIPEFIKCNILMTVNQFILFFFIGKFVSTLLIVFILTVIILWMNNSSFIYLTFGIIFSGSYFAYRYIPQQSYLNILKYINPIALLDVNDLFSNYSNINFFSIPLKRITVSTTVSLIGIIIFILIIIQTFVSTRDKKQIRNVFSVIIQKIRIKTYKFFGSVNLFYHENYKLYISANMLLILVIVAWLSFGSIIKTQPSFSLEDQYYLQYMQTIEGELTPEKETYIKLQRIEFDLIPQKQIDLYQQVDEGKIDKSTFEYQSFLLESELKRETAFLRVEEQYNWIIDLQKQGEKAGFVSEISANYVFNNKQRDIKNGLILILLTILSTSAIFCRDYKNNINIIINATKHGKCRLYLYKLVTSIIVLILFMIVIYVPQYINMCKHFSLGDMNISIRNIIMYKNFSNGVSVLNFIFYNYVFSFFTSVSVICFIILISIKIRKQAATVIISCTVLLIPFLLELLSIDSLRLITHCNSFMLFSTLQQNNAQLKTIINLVMILVLGLSTAVTTYRMFTNKRIFRRKVQ